MGVEYKYTSRVLDSVYYIVKDWPKLVSGKVSLIGQEQGLRARIMKLAYIRDVGIGTVLEYILCLLC